MILRELQVRLANKCQPYMYIIFERLVLPVCKNFVQSYSLDLCASLRVFSGFIFFNHKGHEELHKGLKRV